MGDYDELWNEYAIQFNDKLEDENGGDWSRLDELEQEIAALWKLAADMYGGGFDEFFLNWGYDCYGYAMRGLRRLTAANTGLKRTDCDKLVKLFDTAYKQVFARFENDSRLESCADILRYLTEEDRAVLEKTYEAFDEKLGPLCCQMAYEYYCETLKKAV